MVGPATDINIQAKEMEKLRQELNQILATSSGQPLDRINKDTDRDFYLRIFQLRDGQWHQCKTWLSRQLFF